VTTYAVQQDLEDYFGSSELLIAADRDGDGEADEGVVASGLNSATAEINSYLAVRYDIPLAETPEVLTRVCCDLAMYHMSVGSPSMTEDKETRYNNCIKWLRDVSKGVASLGAAEAQVEVQDEATVSSSSEERLFSRTKMQGLL